MSDKNNNEEYDLYTEHIVKEPFKKAKRVLRRGLIVFVMAVFFGAVAGGVMFLIYRTGKHYTDKKVVESTTEQPTTIDETTGHNETTDDETTVEKPTAITTDPSTDIFETDFYKEYHKELSRIVKGIKQSIVKVTVSRENTDWFSTSYQNVLEETGVVFSADNSGYLVMTSFNSVKDMGNIVVTYPNGETDTAVFVAGDSTTDIAVLKTASISNGSVKVAVLGNSLLVAQGEPIIAVGNLYGFADSIGYGIATSTDRNVNVTDAEYGLITTDILGYNKAAGVLANDKGEIVGVITNGYDSNNTNLIAGYSVSTLNGLLEKLRNGKTMTFFGIKGQGVTDEIKHLYQLPEGVYVSSVENNSPAYTTGIQAGDVITKINETSILTMNSFMKELNKCSVGETVKIVVKRKGREDYKEIEFSLVLGVK